MALLMAGSILEELCRLITRECLGYNPFIIPQAKFTTLVFSFAPPQAVSNEWKADSHEARNHLRAHQR
jgi:hypothetical protein